LGFQTLSIVLVLKNKLRKNTTFRKLDLFPSSGERKKPNALSSMLYGFHMHHCTDFAVACSATLIPSHITDLSIAEDLTQVPF
jgi:hypothetical protein